MNLTIAMAATVLLGLFYGWTSRINGLFFFGRTARPELMESAEGRAITRTYLAGVAVTTLAAMAVIWLARHAGRGLFMAGPLVEMVAFTYVFARANKAVRGLEGEHPAARATVLEVPLNQAPAYWIPGWAMTALPPVVCVLAVVAFCVASSGGQGFVAGWNGLNERIGSVHLDMVWGMGMGMISAATAMLVALKTSARLRTRMAQYSVRASVVLQWVAAAMVLVVTTLGYEQVAVSRVAAKSVPMVAFVAVLGVMFWNQKRSREFVPAPVEMGADDRWHWGLFYADRNDPALFVQSRCGAGYTLNFGRVLAWPIALALAAYFVAMLFITPQHG